MSNHDKVCVVCLSGPDGVGKTTQARALMKQLDSQGMTPRYQWLRFSHFFALPFLGYMRIIGINRKIMTKDGRCTRHVDLSGAEWLRLSFFVAVTIDMLIGSILKIRIPVALGRTVVCDRFIVDTLVDAAIAAGDETFHESPIGSILMRLIPPRTVTFVLTDTPEVLLSRRPEIPSLEDIELRLKLYSTIATSSGMPLLDCSGKSIEQVFDLIIETLRRTPIDGANAENE